MDKKFQDRIDNYLLNRMDDVEKTTFLREVEQDNEKKEQLEFTRNVKDSIRSREEKLRVLSQFQQQYEIDTAMRATGTDASCNCSIPKIEKKPVQSKKKIWLCISGIAAVLVAGFFAIKPMFVYESDPYYKTTPMEPMRGGDDVFCPDSVDSVDNDTIKFNLEKEKKTNE